MPTKKTGQNSKNSKAKPPTTKKSRDTVQKWQENNELEDKIAIIQSLSMQGLSIVEIAKTLGISEKTLRTMRDKHLSIFTALKKGRETVVATLQNALLNRVKEGDTTAIIYGLKVYGGDFFNDKIRQKTELTGKDGGAIEIRHTAPTIYLPQKED
ncbi:MAG: hypothetical protein FWG68_04730 [Defluviitaleaceae bacterium]|nr:hypothetical protein [Defluviitaleaceae bacterium]